MNRLRRSVESKTRLKERTWRGAVAVQDRVIQRVTREYNAVDNQRVFLAEADSVKPAWAPASRPSAAIGCTECDGCGHPQCGVCEDCSLAHQYSDYWICHGCGELNRRVAT